MDDGFASDISKPPELRDDPEHIGLINGFLVALLNPKTLNPTLYTLNPHP